MLTYLRYALATLCFAASVGCMALWWRSATCRDKVEGPRLQSGIVYLESYHGTGIFELLYRPPRVAGDVSIFNWRHSTQKIESPRNSFDLRMEVFGNFGRIGRCIYFPLWYPALIFALGGVASLRLGRWGWR